MHKGSNEPKMLHLRPLDSYLLVVWGKSVMETSNLPILDSECFSCNRECFMIIIIVVVVIVVDFLCIDKFILITWIRKSLTYAETITKMGLCSGAIYNCYYYYYYYYFTVQSPNFIQYIHDFKFS